MNEDLPLFDDLEKRIKEAKSCLDPMREEENMRLLLTVYPFSLMCRCCDGPTPDTYDEAKTEGWTGIEYDDGYSWNFIGFCPGCVREQEKEIA